MMKFNKEQKPNFPSGHYDVVGDFPVPLKDFIPEMLSQGKCLFRAVFVGVNNSVPGVRLPSIEYIRPGCNYDRDWQLESQKPENLLEQIADRNVIKCHAYGDFGDMHYYFTLDDSERMIHNA